jgi:hypothetical protein
MNSEMTIHSDIRISQMIKMTHESSMIRGN